MGERTHSSFLPRESNAANPAAFDSLFYKLLWFSARSPRPLEVIMAQIFGRCARSLSGRSYGLWVGLIEGDKNKPAIKNKKYPLESDDSSGFWLRGLDLNQRPPGYEPDELPTALPRDMVPETGVEPARDCSHGILSPGRLPIPPLRHRRWPQPTF